MRELDGAAATTAQDVGRRILRDILTRSRCSDSDRTRAGASVRFATRVKTMWRSVFDGLKA